METRVLILGRGNVGSHLAKAMQHAGIRVDLRSSREPLPALTDYNYILIATKDDAISTLSFEIGKSLDSAKDNPGISKKPVVMHTSGSIPLSALADNLPEATPCGVFYPMQTFTKDVAMRYDDIPFLLEAGDPATLQSIKDLALRISPNIIEADSGVRAAYHIGAVLTCNFANHLCTLADEYLAAQNLDFRYLLPLLRQTISKLETTPPAQAQTGPAVRHDQKVIDYHLSQISSDPRLSQIYALLTASIQQSGPQRL